ncbi:hypothetical protein CXG81DRAFT_12693 [Caulochytrium protostelioides]|uniref:Phosphatidylserine decarboxylase proenzyme 1, mitochondrial n=1 Tax=Caulochytrium protostelioides TaxID=1555241 RepID=A0A4P9X7F3_9FUNG|nr:phosphatidylserine decarboxylase [Caulochytrium protostelioides]RKP00871.1 hypothetical protein CXG81DRAFT_12693 [Caulochytrium protostelioides]|eukprot:RKP00871.1 hypothetical protein CXG81DRAFT_12693 [Caulochytrium protostelioides]
MKASEASTSDKDVRVAGPWQVHFYAGLPLKTVSRLWGQMNELTLPVWSRETLFRLYARAFGCNLDEMANPDLRSYPNLATFFYRELRPGVRPIDPRAAVVSPADGEVLNFGVIQSGEVEQVKGMVYSIDAFLGTPAALLDKAMGIAEGSSDAVVRAPDASASPDVVSEDAFASINSVKYSLDRILGESNAPQTAAVAKPPRLGWTQWAKSFFTSYKSYGGHVVSPGSKLYFAVVYLAPGDYHRFHSPTDWVVEQRRHFAGELFSVHPKAVSLIKNLFVLNERVALLGSWRYGFFSMVPVGATNVGSIRIDFDEGLRTNVAHRHHRAHQAQIARLKPGQYEQRIYEKGIPVATGQEMGGFMLGSTVVLMFEGPSNMVFDIKKGQKIQMGQSLARLPDA